jgi:glycolate oxidase FAD binding subunit
VVSGLATARLVEPRDEAEVADVLRQAARESHAVLPRGGGTKLDWAPRARRCDVVLSTAHLDALVEHQPGDLVCVVQAGMRLDVLQARLAEHGQRLSLDPDHGVAATIGGIVAANAQGPLRVGCGTARDLVLGARFVLGDGTVGHSGGKVVKNVAGYDLAKLLVGSLGTLAVLTEVALRLHPLPAAARTLSVQADEVGALLARWRDVESRGVAVAAAALLWPQCTLLLRVEGTEAGVAAQCADLDEGGAVEAVEAAVWDEVRTAVWAGEPRPVAHIGLPRTQLPAVLDLLRPLAERAVALPTPAVVEARLHARATAEEVRTLRRGVAALGGNLTVRRPTPELEPVAWPGPEHTDAGALALMRSLKRRLDPEGLLSPGRFLGGI